MIFPAPRHAQSGGQAITPGKDGSAERIRSWSEPGASGIESIAWRMRWEATHERKWKDKLTAYNLEDCVALRRVTEFIYSAIAAVDPARDSRPSTEGGPAIALVQEIDRLGSDRRRGRVRFFHPDFEHISNCTTLITKGNAFSSERARY